MDEPGNSSASRGYSRIAWLMCGLVCVFALINLYMDARAAQGSLDLLQLTSGVGFDILPVVFAVVSALVISRQPRNPIGWLLMSPAVLGVLSRPMDKYLGGFTSAPSPTLPNLIVTWFASWSWLLLIFPLLLILLLFPTGRPPSPRWRWVLGYALGMFLFLVLMATFSKNLHESNDAWTLPNPIGVIPDGLALVNDLITVWVAGLAVLVVICAASLFVRYRRAPAVERLQIKWLLYAGALFVLFYVPSLLWLGNSSGPIGEVINLLLVLSSALFPSAIAIAILRYRLWDIDVIIRRTLIYSVLTAFLGLIFYGSVVLLEQLVGSIAGMGSSPVAIVISTLAIAALFAPLRRLVQNVIDRRFYRKSYNTQLILARFAATSRDEVEIEQLEAHLLSVVKESLQPESVSLLLIRPKRT